MHHEDRSSSMSYLAIGLAIWCFQCFVIEVDVRRWTGWPLLIWMVSPIASFTAIAAFVQLRARRLKSGRGKCFVPLALAAFIATAPLVPFTRLGVYVFVLRNMSDLQIACSGEIPNHMRRWGAGRVPDKFDPNYPIPPHVAFTIGGWATLAVIHSTSGPQPRAPGYGMMHLFGGWYYFED